MGYKRRCPACGKEQVVTGLGKDKRYHCKKCGHRFTRAELNPPKSSSR